MQNSNRFWLNGLLPATFTPLHADGSLNLVVVEPMVEHLIRDGITGLYVCGSTGEGVSLAREERMATAEAFITAARGHVPVVVQIGHQPAPRTHLRTYRISTYPSDPCTRILCPSRIRRVA